MSGNSRDGTEKPPLQPGSESRAEDTPELDEATQERLGRMLTRDADEFVPQPMPDVFRSLLTKLGARERGE
jgi:hypothetical protein